jgi:DHA2 family multidrug resistance protein
VAAARHAHGHGHEAYHAAGNPWLIAVVATLATFMEVLDTSIANVALPHISGNLGAELTQSTWILTAYLVSNAIVLPLSAWASSLIGRKNFYMLCVSLFGVSSLLCGLAPSLGWLVFFRLLQGLGGGGLQPSTQAILVDTFPPRQRGMGMAVYGITVVVAPVIGPTLGGWITDNFSWRWIFFINVPVGIVSLLLTSRLITDPPYLQRRAGAERFRIDYVGIALLSIGLGTLQMVLDLGERYEWFANNWIALLAATSIACLLAVVYWECHHPDPIVNLRLLANRNFGLATLTMLVFGLVLFGSLVLLPLFVQSLLGYTAYLSGLVLSPGGLVVMVLMPLIGWMVSRFDARWMIVFGALCIAASLWMMGRFSLGVDFRTVVWARIVQGFGLAFIFVPVNTLAYATIPARQRNQASSLISLARNIGASVGIAVVATLLSRHTQANQALMVRHASPYSEVYRQQSERLTGALDAALPDPDAAERAAPTILAQRLRAQAGMLAYVEEFRTLALASLLVAPLVLAMRRVRHAHADLAAH